MFVYYRTAGSLKPLWFNWNTLSTMTLILQVRETGKFFPFFLITFPLQNICNVTNNTNNHLRPKIRSTTFLYKTSTSALFFYPHNLFFKSMFNKSKNDFSLLSILIIYYHWEKRQSFLVWLRRKYVFATSILSFNLNFTLGNSCNKRITRLVSFLCLVSRVYHTLSKNTIT